MPTWTLRSKEHIIRPVLVVPGFNQGRSQRGAWFAWTQKSLDFFKRFVGKDWKTVEYAIYEPSSSSPLSDGEIRHLAYEIASRDRGYFEMLDFSEGLFGGKLVRWTGIRGLFLYLTMILTVNQWWIIILLRPWMFLVNAVNAVRKKQAGRAIQKTLHLFAERGKNPSIKEALTEAKEIYQSLTNNEPMRKYQHLRNYFKQKRKLEGDPEREEAFALVEQAYRDIISQLLGDSLLIKLIPTTILQRISQLIFMREETPHPDNIFAVRNLSKELQVSFKISPPKIVGQNRLDGNTLEMFTLWTKEKDPIIVPAEENFFSFIYGPYMQEKTFSRIEAIQGRNLPLEVILYVGTQKEKESLCGLNANALKPDEFKPESMVKTQNRIQAALLDTFRQNEALLTYYMREMPKARSKMINNLIPEYWWYKWVHIGFPWLFISHGIPAFAVVAGTWLFWDPLWESRHSLRWNDFFQSQLQGIKKQYQNIKLKIEVHSGLGDVNSRIRQNKSYRDVMGKIEEYHLPVQLRDMVLFNNITMETEQLNDFQREANNFTTMPIPAFCYDVSGNKVKTLGEVLKSE